MIDYIRGTLVEKGPTTVTVEAHGVGYEAAIPVSTYERLPAIGEQVRILTHYHVREDAHRLFGFWTKPEREAFRRLISVSQIGPKVALGILSGVAVRDLISSVARSDPSRLRGVPGIGPKLAERLMVELKGKLDGIGEEFVPDSGDSASSPVQGSSSQVRKEAFEALISLGYNEKQVQAALARVERAVEVQASLEEWIRKSLQVI